MSSKSAPRAKTLNELLGSLRRLSDADVLFSQAVADRIGLNLTDFKASSILDLNGPMPAGKLAELTGLTTGAITGVLDRLERAGFVRRVKDPADRRHVIVESASSHGPMFEALFSGLQSGLREMSAAYDDRQLALLTEFLGRSAELLHSQTHKMRAESPASVPGAPQAAPLGDLRRARLRFTAGAAKVDFKGGAPRGELYRAKFTGKLPTVKVDAGTVSMSYPHFSLFDFGKSGAELALCSEIPWTLELAGGVSRLRGDLSTVEVESLEIKGGANAVELSLPAPRGIVPLRVSGGASHVALKRPRGVAFAVQVTGGASSVEVDGKKLGGLGGRARLGTDGFEAAPDRYELEITGGANSVVVSAK